MNENRKKVHPEAAKAWLPERRFPMVQPRLVNEPQPRRIPPTIEEPVPLSVGICGLKRLPEMEAARAAVKKPMKFSGWNWALMII